MATDGAQPAPATGALDGAVVDGTLVDGTVDTWPRVRRLVGPGSSALALYGLMAAGLALAIGVDSSLAATALIAAVLVELVVFFVAHACVDTLAGRYDHPGQGFGQRAAHAFQHDSFLLVGGLPILVIFGVELAVGVDADPAATIALLTATGLLGLFTYVAARLAGASRPKAIGEALLAVLLGAAVLVLKLLLH